VNYYNRPVKKGLFCFKEKGRIVAGPLGIHIPQPPAHRGYAWADENSHIGVLNFCPIFIPLFGRKVSGVSVQDML
jgi:hypothetical protein